FVVQPTRSSYVYTLSLHDALPISSKKAESQGTRWKGLPSSRPVRRRRGPPSTGGTGPAPGLPRGSGDRGPPGPGRGPPRPRRARSEEHTSELQSREISYAVFCLKK